MTDAKILMIATSAAKMHNGDATGVWLEELTTPYYAFSDAGAEVTLTSIAGGAIPVDDRSVAPDGENDASVERYLKDAGLKDKVANTLRFTDIDAGGFDAVFLPGGHGTMFDYPDNAELAAVIEAFDRAGKIVAAVCHGPAGLVGVLGSDGLPFVQGRRLAAFTDSEEHAVGLQDAVPFLLETRLKQHGAKHEAAPDFEPFAIRDGNLITGQNPASAQKTADLVLDAVADIRDAA
ncbi:MAG: type 1 glutamine amidotransferase domain-containing protein [Pseudomonadota bacterium]